MTPIERLETTPTVVIRVKDKALRTSYFLYRAHVNITLLTIFSLVYEATLDSQIDESQHDLERLHNTYRIFLNHLSRNLFFAVENRDRWGDYIDPFLYELADAILRKAFVFSSLIYNLGFKIEWKENKISKLTWFPLHLT